MEAIFNHEMYLFVKQYVEPGMLIMVPILLFFGWMMKSTPHMQNWLIPYINTIIGIGGGLLILETVADGMVQGVLVSALTSLTYSMYSQFKKKDDLPTPQKDE